MKPKTLQQAIQHFSDEQTCIDTVAALRWPDSKPVCPSCEKTDHYWLATQKRWKCKDCWKQFSVKVNTIFEDSALPLGKWLMAMWMIANCKNGVSSYEIGRDLGITQKSAWHMLHRIRLAMQKGSIVSLGGPDGTVEIDETFIGGKARNMHMDVKKRRLYGRGTANKVVVMGFLERGGEVHAKVVPNRHLPTMQGEVKKHVKVGSALYTDDFSGYRGLESEYVHKVVDHASKYVDGLVHTNGMENFWSLLKRSIGGTYVSVEPFHLFRYLDEQSFRFNNRAKKDKPVNDGERFEKVLSMVAGKRLTYDDLTGKLRAEAF